MSSVDVPFRAVELVRPLRVPAYRRLWGAQLVSEIGDYALRRPVPAPSLALPAPASSTGRALNPA